MASPFGLKQRIEAALDGERRRSIIPAGWRCFAWAATALVSVVAATLGVAGAGAAPQEPASPAEAATLVVSPDGTADFTSIQAAVEAAVDGARIEIRAGSYQEKVRVNKSVALVGSGWESCQIVAEFGADAEPTLMIATPAVTQVKGLKVTSLGTSESGSLRRGAALVIDGATATIEDCAVLGSPASGVSVSGDGTVSMTGCLIAGAWAEGLVVRQAKQGEGRVLIKGCAIRNNHHNEIMIGGGAPRTRVEGNLFIESGISCWFENKDTIVGNTFIGDPGGGQYASSNAAVAIIGQSRPRIERNVMATWKVAVSVGESSSDGPTNALATEWVIVGNVFWKNSHMLSVMGGKSSLDEAAKNVEADPGFINAAAGDYSLASDSVARAREAGAMSVLPQKSSWAMQEEEKAVATGPDSTSARRKRQALQAKSMERQKAAAESSKTWVDGALQIRNPDLRKASVASILAALQSGESNQVEAGLMALMKITAVEFDKAPFEAVTRELAMFQSDKVDTREILGGLWGARVSPEVAEHIIGLAQKGSRYRHDAIYFGLSTFYEKSPAVLEALFEACEDPDHNNSGRALWGLTYGVPEASYADVADFLILLFEARSSASIRRDCLQGLRTYAGAQHRAKLEELEANELLSEDLRSSIDKILARIQAVENESDK